MPLTVHGLKNCDTCRKALKWLAAEGIEHAFRDVRADGLDATDLKRWADALGWQALLNRRGTTWRGLPDADKARVGDDAAAESAEAAALALMETHPALIKRPVFDRGGATVRVGFTDEVKDWVKG